VIPRRVNLVPSTLMAPTKQNLDFIVVGAQKAGTTSLFEYLRLHPEVWIPSSKEAWYFSHDSIYERGWQDYLATYFHHADPEQKWGTVTPSYMVGGVYDPALGSHEHAEYDEHTVPKRIADVVPAAKLVALLRDPVERAYSHHRMQVLNGSESRGFDEAVSELLTPNALAHSRRFPEETNGYITWGEYGRVLGAYLDYFPPEQILLLFTSDLARSPLLVLRTFYDFIGIEPSFVPNNIGTRYRPGASERRLAWLKIPEARRAVARYSGAKELWHRIPDRKRQAVDSAYENFAYRLDLWNRRSDSSADGRDERVVELLRDHFAPDARMLRGLYGATVPWLADWGRDSAEEDS
jgi:hypothetical protein